MIPITEFRTMPVSAAEPTDRTIEGTVAGDGACLDLGSVDTTDEAQNIRPSAVWWRVADMNGCTEITNIRVWLAGTDALAGANAWHMTITDEWRRGATPAFVATGTPGDAPLTEPSSNITRIGGGPITGSGHDQTSQYIYLAGTIGVNEAAGEKTGLTLMVTYDYR